MGMKEKYLRPCEVAEILGISVGTARVKMAEMPGCINVGGGDSHRALRVPESGLEAWRDNRVICMTHSTGKIARRPIGRQRKEA